MSKTTETQKQSCFFYNIIVPPPADEAATEDSARPDWNKVSAPSVQAEPQEPSYYHGTSCQNYTFVFRLTADQLDLLKFMLCSIISNTCFQEKSAFLVLDARTFTGWAQFEFCQLYPATQDPVCLSEIGSTHLQPSAGSGNSSVRECRGGGTDTHAVSAKAFRPRALWRREPVVVVEERKKIDPAFAFRWVLLPRSMLKIHRKGVSLVDYAELSELWFEYGAASSWDNPSACLYMRWTPDLWAQVGGAPARMGGLHQAVTYAVRTLTAALGFWDETSCACSVPFTNLCFFERMLLQQCHVLAYGLEIKPR
ncbi:beta-carotene 15, 15-dioxygenase 2, like [Lates japonicus]|uniref:Beta-carotene 15, 15-dioxygenase 2, like n=1 Tax=Lates japonicus TaxID=270547 RepID=A0AAD3RFA4_LATJO|nr:beta-carotene 15, 15-dioxygenase 2, like [Lates japonicus]